MKILKNPRFITWTIVSLLALAVLLTQLLALGAANRQSDFQIIQNPLVVGIGIGARPFAPFYAQLGTPGLPYYRPLTVWSYNLNYLFSGATPAGFRLVNIVLHFLTALLAFQLIRVLTGNLWVAGATAFLFALHPVASSVASSILGREEVLFTFLLLLAWKLHLRATDPARTGGTVLPLVLASATFTAALLSNEKALIFLGIVLFGDMTFRREEPSETKPAGAGIRRYIPAYAAYCGMAAVYLLWKYAAIGVRPRSVPARIEAIDNPILYQSAAASLLNAVKLSGIYLTNTLWQVPPKGEFYDYTPVASPVDLWLLLSLTIWVLIGLLVWQAFRRVPQAFAPVWIFALGILPALNLFSRTRDVIADQHMYFPALASALGFALLGNYLKERGRPKLVWGCGLVLVLLLMVIDFRSSQRIASELGWMQSLQAIDPLGIKINAKLAQVMTATRRAPDAVALMEKVAQAHPDSSLALSELARAQAGARSPDTEKTLEQAKKALPHIGEPYLIHGNLLETTGQDQPAVQQYEGALQAEPNSARSLSLLGVIHERLKQLDKAEAYYRQSLEKNPGSAPTCVNLGSVLAQKNRMQDAVGYYELGLKLDPTLPEAYLNLAIAYGSASQPEAALEMLETAHHLFPNSAQFLVRLGQTYTQQRNFDKAVSLFKEAAAANPNEPTLQIHLGNAYAAAGEYKLAVDQYQKVITANPKLIDPYLNLGQVHRMQKNYPEAVDAYRKALEISPKEASLFYNIANTYREAKQYPESIAAYRQALELNPNDARAYYNLGATYEAAGKIPEAIQSYEEFLKRWTGGGDLPNTTRATIDRLRKKGS